MEERPVPAPRKAGFGLRWAAIAFAGLAIATAGALGVGATAWWAGGIVLLAIALTKFPIFLPSRWRLVGATNRWWVMPVFSVMLILVCLAASGVFHSFGLLVRAAWSSVA